MRVAPAVFIPTIAFHTTRRTNAQSVEVFGTDRTGYDAGSWRLRMRNRYAVIGVFIPAVWHSDCRLHLDGGELDYVRNLG